MEGKLYMILTAGPSITKKEINYVLDAVKTAWNEGAYKYVEKFEYEFAKMMGKKYALTTSGGTHALKLAFASIGLKKGDEVIVPDLAYFSPVDAIVELGAKPVFVDILPDTWCIDPEAIRKAITKKTKAIMPVYMYGNLPESKEIRKIANKNGIYVIDDACPAVGSTYYGKPAGCFSDIACYSFQGAKIMVSGLGGMIVTNNKKLYERAKFLNKQGQPGVPKFWQEEHGYSFDMSDINAALGLAQLERLDELVKKKQQIFDWYYKRLGDRFPMNVDRKHAQSNKWMVSIVINDRDKVREKLRYNGIDTRPFFYPVSCFPMYKTQQASMAHYISSNGINLPSGHNLTEEQVDYICKEVMKAIYG